MNPINRVVKWRQNEPHPWVQTHVSSDALWYVLKERFWDAAKQLSDPQTMNIPEHGQWLAGVAGLAAQVNAIVCEQTIELMEALNQHGVIQIVIEE